MNISTHVWKEYEHETLHCVLLCGCGLTFNLLLPFPAPPTVATTTSDPTITARTSDLNATETTSDLTTTAPTSDSTLALSIVVPLSVLVPYSVLVLFVSMCVLAVYFLRKKKVEMIHECPTIEDKKVTDFV